LIKNYATYYIFSISTSHFSYHCSQITDNDFYIGLPEQLEHRVARITNPKMMESIVALLSNGLLLANAMYQYAKTGDLLMKALSNPAFLSVMSVSFKAIKYLNCRVTIEGRDSVQ
jgi:hypothetical protein